MDETVEGRKQARDDVVAGAVLFAVSVVGAVSLLGNEPLRSGEFGRDPGPGLLPAILIALLAAGSLTLAAIGLVRLRRTRSDAVAARTRPGVFTIPALMVATLGLYLWALAPLGFAVATAAFTVLWTILLGWQDDGTPTLRRAAVYVTQAAAIVAAVWVVFAELIKVPLP